jgi:sugar lactone lactonase YvrE
MSSKTFVFVAACAAFATGCSPDPETGTPAQAPEASTSPAPSAAAIGGIPANIVAERGGFIPEGIEYDQANRRFLTGSLAEGSIFEIGTDGSVTPVITDPELVSSVGIEVDEPRDRLLVANSDRTVFQPGNVGQAKLGVYSLTTGERLAMVDLAAALDEPSDPPAYFANDVAVDADGNAYITDTRQNVLYRVDAEYQASVLHRFAAMEGGAALNGIVYHPNGYLLVAAGSNLFKVPVVNPGATAQVAVAEPVPGSDGVVWAADGRLVITSNSADSPRVVALTSGDDWATARTAGVATMNGQATTAAAVGDDIYAVHPHFADAEPPSIERASFR